MNAGYVGLTEVYTPERALALNEWGDGLRERLNRIVRRHGVAMQFTGRGSMMSVHMTVARFARKRTRPAATARCVTCFGSI